MPPFTIDLTDPQPVAVEAAMADAVKTANGKARVGLLKPDLTDYRKFLADEFAAPEGVLMWLSDQGRVAAYPPTPRGTLLGVVWRTTPLGRTVRVVGRRIEPFQEGPSHRFGPPYRPWPPLCHLDPDHAVTRQFTGSEPEVIAVCACGAVGRPEQLAWEAEGVCGPCHDHAIDTGAPLEPRFGPPALRTEGQLRRVGWLPAGDRLAAWVWLPGSYGHASSQLAVWDRHGGACQADDRGAARQAVPATKFAAGLVMWAGSLYWIPAKGAPASLPVGDYYSGGVAVHGTTAAALRYDGEVWSRELTTEGAWQQCWPARRGNNPAAYFSYYCIAFAPTGDRVALGRRGGLIDVLDWPAGTGPTLRSELSESQRDAYRVHALAFSPDGKLLATAIGMSGFVEDPAEGWYGWGGGLHLIDLGKGECVAQFPRERDDILAVAFSPDGTLLFSGATDCQIRVVDIASRQEVAVLCGHVGCVNHLAFSPDGETLASAGGDGLVRLWPWRQLLDRPVPKAKKR
jgi:hypothetical protein